MAESIFNADGSLTQEFLASIPKFNASAVGSGAAHYDGESGTTSYDPLPMIDIGNNMLGQYGPLGDLQNIYYKDQSKGGYWRTNGSFRPYDPSRGGGFGGFLSDLGPVAPIVLGLALPGAGAALGSALGTSAAVGSGLIGAGLSAAQGASGADILKGAALGAVGGEIGSNVAGATGNAALGQVAGGTSAGLLSGKDFETSLSNAALNTGTQQVAQGLLNSSTTPNNYSVSANYSLGGSDSSGGLGLKASLAPIDSANPYGFTTADASTGGLGLNYNTTLNTSNLENMGGAQGLSGQTSDALKNNLAGTSTSTGATPESNLLGKLLMATLTGDGSSGSSSGSSSGFGSLVGGLLGGAANLWQGSTNKAANQALADQLRTAGTQAQQQAQFRPVGITNTFGTSNFQVNPQTGQLESANYSLSPALQEYQNSIMGANRQSLSDAAALSNLGRGYVAQSPEAAAQSWLQSQQALLAPSREQAWANLANQDYNRGTMGLKVAQGGNLQSANPYAAALANAQSLQDLQLASQAQQQGQNQVKFGQGLLTSAYDPFNAGLKTASSVESLGQNPFSMSTDLAKAAASSNATAAGLGLKGNIAAAEAMRPVNQYNPGAQLLGGLGSSPLATSTLGNLFSNSSIGTSLGNWLGNLSSSQRNQAASDWLAANRDAAPESTFNGGGADFLDEETRRLLGLD